MSRDLLRDPAWQAADLGQALPDDPHAVSVALPLWEHCVGYEERSPAVVERLACGYPRFVIHPLVQRCAELARQRHGQADERALVLASELSARRALAYLATHGVTARVVALDAERGAWALLFPDGAAQHAKDYWQHSGEGISSRQAQAILAGSAIDAPARRLALAEVRERLADLYGCGVTEVFVYPSGMAAIAAAVRVLLAHRPGRRSVQLGFPYVDVLKVPQRLGAGAELITGCDAAALDRVAALVSRETLSACVVETPGNPLLSCVDLPRLAALLRPERVPLVVDDTVATALDVDVTPWADLIVTSLTKAFVGCGTVMGGALIVPPASPLAGLLRDYAQAQHEDLLWWEDACLLAVESRDVEARVRRMDATAQYLAERLLAHPAVKRVHHPSLTDRAHFDRIRRAEGGYGCLLSYELEGGGPETRRCYDATRISKGPSLGTDFSLLCPFTILAHYHELPWAEACGVSRWLLRLSVGLEEPEQLWTALAAGLAAC